MLQQRLETLIRQRSPRACASVSLRLAGAAGPHAFTAAAGVHGGAPPLFLAYSCTKTVIAALVLLLCESGRTALSAPLARWFPAVPEASDITLRHLLNHTSGLPDYGTLAAYHEAVQTSPSTPWSAAEFVERTLAQGMLFRPGEGWSYSNTGYLLLKRIAEMENNRSLRLLVQEKICRLLGLGHTFVAETVADLQALQPARSDLVAMDKGVDIRTVYHPGWVAHGTMASTPAELAALFDGLFSGAIISPAMLAEMTVLTPVPTAPPKYGNPCYGLGLMADTASPYGMILGHNGGGPGYEASVFHVTRGGKAATACAMCSCENSGVAEGLVRGAFAVMAES
ncbi:beta-lactamase family protein [Geomonas sp. RF6]|uniref:serine hydrolase domain-containing protein n=1 Tax=Geomonas sp. RF6 TaxID=2897342 RepID=UPI001E4AD146|nr:serine hydrolase domain-containing protein [Geomonas sp. RF6]UFS68938.1 beta-lactamase family protein [Geomonas sp. RF6]